jgi:hypothetical protein
MSQRKRTREDNADDGAPPTKAPTRMDKIDLPDQRTVYKAELVILDKYSPPQYPPLSEDDAELTEEQLRRRYMEAGCANAVDWLVKASEYISSSARHNTHAQQISFE